MTAHALSPATTDALPGSIAALRAAGLRVSTARRVVLTALAAAPGPATAEQIASGFDGAAPQSDRASVYRNLDTFQQLGIVHQLPSGRGAGRYVLALRATAGYFTCARCDTTDQLAPGALDALRRAVSEHAAHAFAPLAIVGLCADCR